MLALHKTTDEGSAPCQDFFFTLWNSNLKHLIMGRKSYLSDHNTPWSFQKDVRLQSPKKEKFDKGTNQFDQEMSKSMQENLQKQNAKYFTLL